MSRRHDWAWITRYALVAAGGATVVHFAGAPYWCVVALWVAGTEILCAASLVRDAIEEHE